MASGDADATPAAGWFSGLAPAGPGITPKARASWPQASGHDPGTQRIAPPPACLEIAPLRRRWWITGPREPVQPIRRAGPPRGRDMSAVAPIRVLKWPSDGDEGAGMACGKASCRCRPGGSVPSCRPFQVPRATVRDARQRGTRGLPPGRRQASRRPGLGPAPRILAVSVLGVPVAACGPPPAPKREASRTCLPGPGDYRLHPRRLFFFSKVSPAQQQDKVVEVPQPHRCTQSNRLDFM